MICFIVVFVKNTFIAFYSVYCTCIQTP